MSAKILLTSIAIILFSATVNAAYNVNFYCRLVPTGTKFPNLDNCQSFYTCRGNGQVQDGLCPKNYVFDKNAQGCVAANNGNCNRGLDNPCQNKNEVWVADTKVCSVWHYCNQGKILGSGSCSNGQIFDNKLQKCTNGQCSQGELSNDCEIMQDGKFYGDYNDCKVWHKCMGLTQKHGNCANGLIYDPQTRNCIYGNGNTCGGPAATCNENSSNKKLPDSGRCSNYFVCLKQNNKWLWKKTQCPIGQYFNPASNSCLKRHLATPIKTCDRCEYSYTQWVNAVDPECKTYLVCSNGVKTSTNSCPHGIFDEQKQKCVLGTDLVQYRQTNGACAAKAN